MDMILFTLPMIVPKNGGRITNVARGGLAVKKRYPETAESGTGNSVHDHTVRCITDGNRCCNIHGWEFRERSFRDFLKDGKSTGLREIPAGFSYTVTEADDALRDGYTVTATGTSERSRREIRRKLRLRTGK